MAETLANLLSTTTVEAIPLPKGQIVIVESSDLPVHGFAKLLDNNILSAPVLDKTTGKYTGFLDIRDLVSFCCFIHDNNDNAENLLDIVNFGVKMFKHAIDGVTVTYLSRRNPFHAVRQGSPLQHVVDILATGVRRVPIVDGEGHVINIVSQSSIVQFIQHHIRELGDLFSSTVAVAGLGSAPVLTVRNDTKAIDVFRLMDHHQRSGVAVVDHHGVLVGNTSGHDLKLFINTPSLAVLQLPIMQFLNQIRQMNLNAITPVIACNENDTLATVIGKLAATRVHRVFVADPEFKPTKVISITDILRHVNRLFKQLPGHH